MLSAISIVLIIKGVDLGLIILLTLALVSIFIIYARFMKGGFLMKIKVAVAKSVKALVGHMAKAACGSASHWGHINLKNLNLRKKRSNR